MKTQDKIVNVLKEHGELESLSISKRIGLSYDTTSRYLKGMIKEHILTREARQMPKRDWDNKRPWEYYYKLNERYKK